jgi:hypothetical protein
LSDELGHLLSSLTKLEHCAVSDWEAMTEPEPDQWIPEVGLRFKTPYDA